MWKLCRNRVFTRWPTNRKHTVENKPNEVIKLELLPSCSRARFSHGNGNQKQQANKQSRHFWEDPHFYYNSFTTSLLETVGFVGTAVTLCLNLHHRHFHTSYQQSSIRPSSCIFSKFALTMPQDSNRGENTGKPPTQDVHSTKTSKKQTPSKSSVLLQSLDYMITHHTIAAENSTGLKELNRNSKKAFHCFQEAAKLGSSQGLYNLGLCYEFGNGTTCDLKKAAECYRQAAMKGHGPASFNLGVYFLKGLGGLPVDPHTAHLLFMEAAEKLVPEAQLYLGLQYLEDEVWAEAFNIFHSLAKENNLDGKYYAGLCYENGWGVNRDTRLAAEMFSQAAAQGHTKATLALARFYKSGQGECDCDREFALTLYQMLTDKDGKKTFATLKNQSFSSTKLHTSTSVPELGCDKKKAGQSHKMPPHLDLILPIERTEKPSFFLGDAHLVPHLHNKVPSVVAVHS